MCNTVGNTVCCLGGHWDDPNYLTLITPWHVKRIFKIKGDRFQNNSSTNDVIRNLNRVVFKICINLALKRNI